MACLSLEPAAYTLLLCHSPLQPNSRADAHHSLSSPRRAGTLGKPFPPPCSPVSLFSNISPFLNCRTSSLFNTTCSPHAFWKCRISIYVCLQLPLFTTHHKGSVSVYFMADWMLRRDPASAPVRTQSCFVTVEIKNAGGMTWCTGVGSKSALELNFSKYVTRLRGEKRVVCL